jgi:RNA polymerase sigma factor (sigma-70 family)
VTLIGILRDGFMTAELQVLVRHVRRMAGCHELATLSDRELLQKFWCESDQDAFALVVKRHAMLVAGVCRRVLRNEQDVEDAFQASFLVLYRRGRSLFLPISVAGWLHRVAYHVAIRARRSAARRQALEQEWGEHSLDLQKARLGPPGSELREVLDRELVSLPSAARLAVILCYLEGRTRDQAASQLGCSVRTLDRRLEDGRRILRLRLARRGLDLSVVMLGLGLGMPREASAARLAARAVHQIVACSSGLPAETSGLFYVKQLLVGQIWGANYGVFGAAVLAFCLAAVGGGVCWLATAGARPITNERVDQSPRGFTSEQKPRIDKDLYGDLLPKGAVARLGGARFRVGRAQNLSYSPDGKYLFAGSQSGIRIFDAQTGLVIRELIGDQNQLCDESLISPDGKIAAICVSNHLVTAFDDRTITLQGPMSKVLFFGTETGKPSGQILIDVAMRGNCLGAFSPNASLLAIATSRNSLCLHDVRSGMLLHKISWPREAQTEGEAYTSAFSFLEIAFSPDGQKLYASSHISGLIRVFDVRTGEELKQLKVRAKGIAGMKLSKDGSRLAVLESASAHVEQTCKVDEPGNRILVLESAYGRQLAEMTVPCSIKSMGFSPNGHSVIARTSEQAVCVWETDTGKLVRALPFSRKALQGCAPFAVSPDGRWIARGDTASISVSELETGNERPIAPGHTGVLSSIAIHPFEAMVATSAQDGRILLWDRTSGRLLRELFAGTASVNSLRYSPDGRYLIAITDNSWAPPHSTIRCWDARSGKELWKIFDHAVHPNVLAVSANSKKLAALGRHGALIVDVETGIPVRVLAGESEHDLWCQGNGSPASLAFNRTGDELVAWGNRNGLHRWKVASGELQVSKISDKSSPLTVFAPDSNRLALGGRLGEITLMETISGKKIVELTYSQTDWAGAVNGAAFSHDGKRLAWAKSFERQIHILDAGTGANLQRLACPSGVGPCLAFGSDDNSLVTDGGDGTALVWDLAKLPVEIPAKLFLIR